MSHTDTFLPNDDLDEAELKEAIKARKKEIRDEENDTRIRVQATIVNSMGPYGQKQLGIGPARLFTNQPVAVVPVDRRLKALSRLVQVSANGVFGKLENAIVDEYILQECHPANNAVARRNEARWEMIEAAISSPATTLVGDRLQRYFTLAAARPPWPPFRAVAASLSPKPVALSELDLLLEEELGMRWLGIVVLSCESIAAIFQWDTNDIQAAFALVLTSHPKSHSHWGEQPMAVRATRVLKKGDVESGTWWYVGWTLVDPEVKKALN